jgi:precorrin-2 dehydrogenase/sirohydrochlorin ferrochelatase
MQSETNTLFPIFLKLEALSCLVVGGGSVGLEKVNALVKSSPEAFITVVAGSIRSEIKSLTKNHSSLQLVERDFEWSDLEGKHVLILATDNKNLHKEIYAAARERKILINVADTPALCDFYLGAVVTKGNLKLGISTNGKSPTMAKRIREFFEEIIPESTDELLSNMNAMRSRIKGDFELKVHVLNEITSGWLKK